MSPSPCCATVFTIPEVSISPLYCILWGGVEAGNEMSATNSCYTSVEFTFIRICNLFSNKDLNFASPVTEDFLHLLPVLYFYFSTVVYSLHWMVYG